MADSVVLEVNGAYEAAVAAPDDPERLGELGMLHYAAQSPGTAAKCFELAVELAPADIRWRYYLGIARNAAFDTRGAIHAYEEAMKLRPAYGPLIIALAGLILQTDVARADGLYAKAIEVNPTDVAGYLGRGACAEKLGDLPLALDRYQQALKLFADHPQVHGALARVLSALGRKTEAAAHLRLVPRDYPAPLLRDPLLVELLKRTRNAEFLIRLGQEYAAVGQFDEAMAVLLRAVETDQTRTSARETIGVVQAMQGRLRQAAETLEAVLQIDPADASARSNLAKVYVDLGRYDEAGQLYRSVLRSAPDDWSARSRFGEMLLITGRIEQAVTEFNAVAQAKPDDSLAQFDLAAALVFKRDYGEAVQTYRTGLDRAIDRDASARGFARRLVGLIGRQSGGATTQSAEGALQYSDLTRLAEAFKARGMDREADLCRNHLPLICEDAMAQARQGRAEQAIACLTRLVGSDPGGTIHNTLGNIYSLRGQFPQAAQAFRIGLEAQPGANDIRRNLANVLLAMGQLEEAERVLRDVLAREANHIETLRALAKLLDKRGQADEARPLLERVLAANPQDAESRRLLARILARAGKDAEALEQYQLAIQIEPSNAVSRYQFGVLLNRMGRLPQASSQWQQALLADPRHVDARLALAAAAMSANDYASAQQIFKQGLALLPDSAELANGLAWALATATDPARRDGEWAVQWARKACEATKDRNPHYLSTLAAAYAEKGQFNEAVEAQARSITLLEQGGDAGQTAEAKRRLELYKARQVYRRAS